MFDCSLPHTTGPEGQRAWYVPSVLRTPVRWDQWVGSVSEGGRVNFFEITFHPHGNGTHTECQGHITEEFFSITEVHIPLSMPALLLSLEPQKQENGDSVLALEEIQKAWRAVHPTASCVRALCLRTLPNLDSKKTRKHSHTNPVYLSAETMEWIVQQGIDHLVVDQMSVDREEDGGNLIAHRIFWGIPAGSILPGTRPGATLTELAFFPNEAVDGLYSLYLQVAPLVNDAAPSRPILMPLT